MCDRDPERELREEGGGKRERLIQKKRRIQTRERLRKKKFGKISWTSFQWPVTTKMTIHKALHPYYYHLKFMKWQLIMADFTR